VNRKHINIFHFLLDPRIGGPHVFARTIADALTPEIVSTMVTAGKSSFADIGLVNLRHVWRPLYLFEVMINVVLISVLCLRRGAGNKPSLFDVHGAANLAPLIAARLARIPVVWHFHETEPSFRILVRMGKRFLVPGRFKMVAVAEAVARFYELEDCAILNPPVDTSYWNHRPTGVDEGEKKFTILTVGNIGPVKGHTYLLDALEDLGDEGWHAVIVGAPLSNHGDYYAELLARAGDLMKKLISCTVELAGWKGSNEVANCLQDSDVFVLPSIAEGCPISLLEAMAMRRVCVAADVGGVRDVITDGSSGFIFPPRDSTTLAAALRKVRGLSMDERAQIGNRARESVEGRCSVKSVAAGHLDLYRRLFSLTEPAQPCAQLSHNRS
jgi:glycosyltransferase involved in cell wall biosynthesis